MKWATKNRRIDSLTKPESSGPIKNMEDLYTELHKLEEYYGRVDYVPTSDPFFREAHQYWDKTKGKSGQPKGTRGKKKTLYEAYNRKGDLICRAFSVRSLSKQMKDAGVIHYSDEHSIWNVLKEHRGFGKGYLISQRQAKRGEELND